MNNTHLYVLLSCVYTNVQNSLFTSIFQDVFGRRGLLAIGCAVLTIPVFGLLAFTEVHPLVSTLWLGITYSVAAVSLYKGVGIPGGGRPQYLWCGAQVYFDPAMFANFFTWTQISPPTAMHAMLRTINFNTPNVQQLLMPMI